jgi:TetR/AcrR family transcriptional regulator, fatty acid metabolism regulator protein
MAAATPPQSLKERQRQEREQLILRAAEELLLEKGYHETSMEEIAARVGISKGTVYLHFASKEDLVFALLQRGLRAFLSALDETLDLPLPPREKLEALLQRAYAGMSSRFHSPLSGIASVIFRSPEFHTYMADKRQNIMALWEEPMRRVAAVVKEGQEASEFDPALPISVVVGVFGSLLNPRNYQYAAEREGMPPEEVIKHVSHIFFRGISTAGDAPQSGNASESGDSGDSGK